jgi:hypothetical protein
MAALVAAAAVGVLVLRGPLAGSGGGPLTTAESGSDLAVRPAAARVHVVQPGETLWSIVRSSGVKGDPRPIVDRLASQVHHRPLQAGDRLVLP